MEIANHVRDNIVKAIISTDETGATMTEIERKVKFERHTLAKYLYILKKEGVLDYKAIGKAKLWFVNKAPLKTVIELPEEQKSFIEKILSDIILKNPIGIAIIDKQCTVLLTNHSTQELYGDIEGQNFCDVLGMKDDEMQDILETLDKTQKMEITDNRGRMLRLFAQNYTYPDGRDVRLLSIEDITELNKISQGILINKDYQKAVSELGLFSLDSSVQDTLSRATQLIKEILGVPFVQILEWKPKDKIFVMAAGEGWQEGYVGKVILRDSLDTQIGHTFISKKPIVVNNSDHFSTMEILHDHDIAGGLSVVIPNSKKGWGVLAAHTKQAKEFSDDDIRFVQAVANIIAGSIERKNFKQ